MHLTENRNFKIPGFQTKARGGTSQMKAVDQYVLMGLLLMPLRSDQFSINLISPI